MEISLVPFFAALLTLYGNGSPDFLKEYDYGEIPTNLVQQYFQSWNRWTENFNKTYSSDEKENEDFYQWVLNSIQVYKHNKLFEENLSSFKMSMNEFATTSQETFMTEMFDKSPPKTKESPENSTKYLNQFKDDYPAEMDWRSKGLVMSVKHQGRCASGWAFAAAAAAESLYNKFEGSGISFSVQQLMDCVRSSRGCSGGSSIDAIFYFRFLYGVSDSVYTYQGKKGVCEYDDMTHIPASQVPYVWYLPQDDELSLQIAVAEFGPVAVTFKVTKKFQFYKTGVFHDNDCSSNSTTTKISNHSGLIVGYGTDANHGDYWIVKNSFGDMWGEKGYVRMARNKHNHCGIAKSPFLAFHIPLF